jgi:hypothetical protein
MKFDIQNKAKSIQLKPSEYLFPLFEVVVNAIQAIQHSKRADGEISIFIERDKNLQLKIDNTLEKQAIIKNFRVVDNGIGFNDANYNSFDTAYSDFKQHLGCKGVGRFLSLVAFDRVIVESIFKNDIIYCKREFTFDEKKGLEATAIIQENIKAVDTKTSVYLENYKPIFRKNTSAKSIATKLLEHCLSYYINKSNPKITVYDEAIEVPINLTELFEEKIEIEDLEDKIDLNGYDFTINYAKNYFSTSSNKIHYLANEREVPDNAKPLIELIPDLQKKLSDKKGEYSIAVYVKSKYLDDNLNESRNIINLPKPQNDLNKSEDMYAPISFYDIEKEIKVKVKNAYQSELSTISKDKNIYIENFISSPDGIEYRHLIQHQDYFETIKPNLSNKDLEAELHRINYELEQKHKNNVNRFLQKKFDVLEDIGTHYKNELKEILDDENEFATSRLAKYMLHRKTIINVFEKFLEIQANNEYKSEAHIHNIIFQMGKNETELKYNEHNLWILDERLVYHKYINSDKSLKRVSDANSNREPDLLIYDNKFLYGDDTSNIVIFEFKKPRRTSYSKDEKDLGNQVLDYAKNLIGNKLNNYKGRPLQVDKYTPKFAYIICDFTDAIQTDLEYSGYRKTTKGTLFKYEEGINLLIEVIKYDQLLDDVKLRHLAFFKELGIS